MNQVRNQEGKIVSNKKMRYSVAIYFALSITVIFLFRFVDINNFHGFLYNTSFLFLNQNPYILNPQPFPPNYYSFLAPTFLAYIYSGNNLFFSVDFLKIFQLVISVFDSYLIFLIVFTETGSEKKSRAAFYGILFSPFFFSVNFIETEQSPIGIFFALLAIYLFLKMDKDAKYDYILIVSASILLWYSIFLYYFPIVFIPVLLIYRKSVKNFLQTILGLLIGFLIFYIPFRFLNFWDFFSNLTGAVTPPSNTTTVFSIINFFGSSKGFATNELQIEVQFVFNILFLISMLIVPLIFKYRKLSIFSALATVYTILFLTVAISNVDEYIWIIPFITISMAVELKEKLLILKLFLSQLYMLPYLLIFNMWGAPGYGTGTGIFYLSYLQFHNSTQIYSLVPSPVSITKLLIFLAFLLLLFDIIFILRNRSGEKWYSGEFKKNFLSMQIFHNFKDSLSKWKLNTEKTGKNTEKLIITSTKNRRSMKLIIFSSGLAALIIFSMVNYNINDAIVQNDQNFPLGMFNSYSEMNGSFSYNLTNNNTAVSIAPTDPAFNFAPYSTMPFSRNLSGENMKMNIQISAVNQNNYLYNTTIIKMGSTSVNLLNSLNTLNISALSVPNLSQNTSLTYKIIPIIEGNDKVPSYKFQGSSVLFYSIHLDNFSNKYYFVFHKALKNSSSDEIFFIYYEGLQIEIFSPGNKNSYVISYNKPALGVNWSLLHTYSNVSNYWNIFSFYFANNSIILNMNNLASQEINYNFTNNTNVSLYVGKYGSYNSSNLRLSISGQISAMIVSTKNLYLVPNKLYLSYFNTSTDSYVSKYILYLNRNIYLNYSNENLFIYSNGIHIKISNEKGINPLAGQVFEFGRLSCSNIGLIITIPHLELNVEHGKSYYYDLLFLNTVLPLYVMGSVFVSVSGRFKRKVKNKYL